jgi:hypothetical protein
MSIVIDGQQLLFQFYELQSGNNNIYCQKEFDSTHQSTIGFIFGEPQIILIKKEEYHQNF